MKISIDPENFAGAERYVAKNNNYDADSAGAWIENATAMKFVNHRKNAPKFSMIMKGIGFFWEEIGSTTGPTLQTGVEAKDGDLPELISVTFWVAADAV